MRVLATLDLRLLASFLAAALCATFGAVNAFSARPRTWIAVLAAAGTCVAEIALLASFTVDDAFITFRYARNWAEGLGPIYQAGERVEGCTSFLWMAILAVAHRFGLEMELASKVAGVLGALVAVALLPRLVRLLGAGPREAALAPLLLGASPLFAAWAVAGLETTLFAAVLVAAVLLLFEERARPGGFPWSAVAFATLLLVRPEGGLFGLLALVFVAHDSGTLRIDRAVARWGAVFVAITLPYWGLRWWYYGAFFPNTFYAKTSMGSGVLVGGFKSWLDFAADAGVLQIVLVAVAAVTLRSAGRARRFVAVAVGLFFVYVLLTGGDVQFLRFYVHVLPLWVTLAALGLERLLAGIEARGRRAVAVAIVLAWTTLGYHQIANVRLPEPHDRIGIATVVDVSNHIRLAHGPLGDWLRAHSPADARVVAPDIGVLGYLSQRPIIDLYGLTDRRIATLLHARGSPHDLAEEVRSRKPEMMVFYGSSQGAFTPWPKEEEAWVFESYRPHSFWRDSAFDRGLVLLVRKDLDVPPVAAPGVPLRSI